jgi:hypothetical protein
MGSKLNLVGQRFGKLVVLSEDGKSGTNYKWLCKCDCGGTVSVIGSALKIGNTKSCGCTKKEILHNRNYKHGCRNSPEYESWRGAKKRCFNENCKSYPHYGGRGITMHAGWVDSFESFLEYIGPKPDYEQRWSLGRIDNNGDYEPGNVHWELDCEQARNHSLQSNNKTGHAGVLERFYHGVRGDNSYIVAKVNAGGNKSKRKEKQFSVKEHGRDVAISLAVEWRNNILEKMEQDGIIYAETHGSVAVNKRIQDGN